MGQEHFLSLQPGTIINGRYEVVKCLGTGSMGMVYACKHKELSGHLVAMKVLFSEVARDEIAAARFRNEIVASYGVSHPNVVRAYEYFRDGDLIAFTMEYIDGGDLADRIGSDEPMEIEEIVRMLAQMCGGVQAIHDAGIIHRDLKPENILLTNQGDIKITDFGIARTGTGPKLTEHGGVVGTIDYVSPEYLERGEVDARSDIYALGVLAYEMITGEAPFKGKSVIETMTMRLRSDPVPPEKLRPDCPVILSNIVLRMMMRDPDKRYQRASEILRDLQELSGAVLTTLTSGSYQAQPSMPPAKINGSGPLLAGIGSGNDSGGAAQVAAKKKQRMKSTEEDEEYYQPQRMESVLKMQGGVAVKRTGVDHGISVSQGHLTAQRMGELNKNMTSPRSGSVVKMVFVWLLIMVMGVGTGLFILRHYKPALFAGTGESEIPSYSREK